MIAALTSRFKRKSAVGQPKMKRPFLALFVGLTCAVALYFGSGKSYISLTYDPHEVNCLPELHLALLVHSRPDSVAHGDYLFWKASGSLSYVKETFVLKRVAGIPGDKLVIKDGRVLINDIQVAQGFDNAILYKKVARDFERSETIPANSYFVIGTADLSNDSRYWGYLSHEEVLGRAHRIY